MAVAPPRPKPPPLNALRAFEAAARLGGFSAAAQELCVTQGAIAQQIKHLEDWAGATLFVRHARGVRLSAAGKAVLPRLGEAFDALGDVTQTLRRESAASEVRIADNPIESPSSCFERTGIKRAVDLAQGRLYIPSQRDFEMLNVPGAKLIEHWPFFWRPFIGATKVIGVAPVKDHNLCGGSMTTKNWYGLLGGRRNQFHQDIHTIIADLALMMRPSFVLLDGRRVLYQSGPTGGSLDDVRTADTIVASTDMLAADAYGWDELLRRVDKSRPGYFQKAAALGLGEPQWKRVTKKEVHLG